MGIGAKQRPPTAIRSFPGRTLGRFCGDIARVSVGRVPVEILHDFLNRHDVGILAAQNEYIQVVDVLNVDLSLPHCDPRGT